MGLIPQITCRRCGTTYSGLKRHCPDCKAPRPNMTTRAPVTTAGATEGTLAHARAEVNGRWQMIFAGILALAVVLAVAVLVISGDEGGSPAVNPPSQSGHKGQSTAVSLGDTYLPSPMPTPEPTPEGTPAPIITGLELTFLNRAVAPDISITNDGEMSLQLDVRWFPATAKVTPVWTSSNEKILTVDQTGLVTIVGADPNSWATATITVECAGLSAKTLIHVPNYQAVHLENNLFYS